MMPSHTPSHHSAQVVDYIGVKVLLRMKWGGAGQPRAGVLICA